MRNMITHLLVEGHREPTIDKLVVKDGQCDQPANESEETRVLRIDSRVWIDCKGISVVPNM